MHTICLTVQDAYRFNYTKSWNSTSGEAKSVNTWFYYESTKQGIPVSAKYGNEDVKGISDWYNITSGMLLY